MLQSPNELRLQTALLILFGCSILTGLLSLTADVFPFLIVPERLMLTPVGAVTVVISGFAVFALTLQRAIWRMLAGLMLCVTGTHGLLNSVLTSYTSIQTPFSETVSPLPLFPSFAVLLMAAVSLRGIRSSRGSLFGLISGCIGVAIGAVVLVGYLQQRLSASNDGTIGGFSLAAGLYCLSFGAALVILSERYPKIVFSLRCRSIVLGVLGVSGTFLLSTFASWAVHTDRYQTAETILQHYAGTLEHGVATHTKLIERLADRWAAADFEITEDVKRAEFDRYFKDVPALDSLLLLRSDGGAMWRSSRSAEEYRWFVSQLTQPEILAWLRESRQGDSTSRWLFPNKDAPFKALLVVPSGASSDNQFLALFDIQTLLEFEAPHGAHEFDIALMPAEYSSPLPPIATAPSRSEILVTGTATIPNGPDVILTATAGPPPLFSFRGLFPFVLMLFGLWMSYMLIMGRNLLGTQKYQARQLRLREQQFRSLFSQSPDAVFAFDKRGYYQTLNSVAQKIVGLSDSDVGITHYDKVLKAGIINEFDRANFETAFNNATVGHSQSCEVCFTSPNGSEPRDYDCDFLPIVVDEDVTGVYVIAKDITERRQAEENQRILKKSLESSDNGIVVVDTRSDGFPVVFVNPAFCQMTGYAALEIIGEPVNLLSGPETDDGDIELIKQASRDGRPLSLTLKSYRRDGAPFWNQVSLSPVQDERGQVTHYTAIMRDISDKKEQEKRLAYQATHDALTGLGNRALFEDHLVHDFSLAKRSGQSMAVLFIDLDEFKPINDTLGHKLGDELLISVALRLKKTVRPTDTLARFGGDEFVLLLPELGSVHEAEDVAERILEELGKPHLIKSHELYISASIGISILTDALEHPEKLLQQADMAMYKAKQQGRDTYEIFSQDLDNKLSKRVILRNDLQEAIKSHQLSLHYQPQVNQNGELCGLEALVRWKHPEKGLISPADFIPIAEETGQIVQLGKWVTTQACRDAQTLLDMGLLKGRMAVNLSPMQFHRPSFLNTVRGILERTRLPAKYLELELTEGILMKDTEGAIDILHALAGMGIATAIDDFGTGFSSFSYLRDLPVDKIKIDRSFVSRVTTNEKDAAVCKGVITLAREMDLRVIAEGVETEDQMRFLIENGCEAFQGYYFAKPMPFNEVIDWAEAALASDPVDPLVFPD